MPVAQTFTSGRAGYLDTVELLVQPAVDGGNGRFRVSVQPTDLDGRPSGEVLASAWVSSCAPAQLTPLQAALAITAETRYALVLERVSGTGAVNWGSSFVDYGTRGRAWRLAPGPAGWVSDFGSPFPLAFRTYVSDTASPPHQQDDTTLSLAVNPEEPIRRHRDVTITATVTNPDHPTATPQGSVRFTAPGSTADGSTIALDSAGRASVTAQYASAGEHQVSASFCPSTTAHLASGQETTINVSSEAVPTTVTTEFVPATSVAFQPILALGTVVPGDTLGPPPTGTLTVTGDTGVTIIGPLMLSPTPAGSASAGISIALGAGTWHAHARYSGDLIYAPSEAPVHIGVVKAATTVELDVRPATVNGESVLAIQVLVVSQPESVGIPDGAIAASVDGQPEVRFDLDEDGWVGVYLSGLPAGNHGLNVRYLGSQDFLPSSATSQLQGTVPPASPAPPPASAAPSPVTIAAAPELSPSQLLTTLGVPKSARLSRSGSVRLGTVRNPPLAAVTATLSITAPTRAASRRVVIGRATVKPRPGTNRALTVRLTRAGRRTLTRRRQVRAVLALRATSAAGKRVSATRVVTLRTAGR